MLGLSALGSIVCLIDPTDVSNLLGMNCRRSSLDRSRRFIAAGRLRHSFCNGALAITALKWRFTMPNISLAIGQIVIGTLNFAFVAACLHQVLASEAPVSFVQSATAFVLANVAILVAHVPGGLGVLEATVTTVLPGAASIGGLVAFRVIYFLLPLLLGLPISELIIGSGKKTHLDKGSEKPPQPQAQLL